ncbi:MAG: hypothetical protein LC751_07345, partial [Actinobacteria bacterium]|nr:hypothetical protein [Actinomycetota bacterium]
SPRRSRGFEEFPGRLAGVSVEAALHLAVDRLLQAEEPCHERLVHAGKVAVEPLEMSELDPKRAPVS